MVSLATLRLHSNELDPLPSNLFNGLVTLDILDLAFNNLTTLPTGLFDGLNLQFLALEANQFRTLPAGVFDSLGRGNLVLDVSHNGLTELTGDVFANLDNLVELLAQFTELGQRPLTYRPATPHPQLHLRRRFPNSRTPARSLVRGPITTRHVSSSQLHS